MIKKLSPLWIVIAGCLWSTMGIFVRSFNTYGVESMSIVFIRSLFTAIITLSAAAVYDRRLLKIKLCDIWIFIGMGLISIVLFNFCYFTAISMMSLSAAAILLYTSPVFVMLFSALFFKEKITLRKIIAIIVSFTGLALVTGVFNGSSEMSAIGIVYGIVSAIGYALYSIFSRVSVNKGYNSLTTTGWSFAFAALFSSLMSDIPVCINMFAASPSMILYTLAFAIIASVLPYVLYTVGLKGTETGKAAVIASIEPVSATVLGIFFYGEYPSVSAIIGIILVITALALSMDNPKHKHKIKSP